ncbi:MAG: HAD hydrolase family protein [Planctomycetes bacterium]|nr:HAD hydrolase family protein [Planctomycetota bacterium]
MNYKLLALDLDGTLLDSNGHVPEANRRTIERARKAGMMVALCTGRGLAESRPAINAIDHVGPVVLAGGALVSDPTTGRTLHRATIEPRLAAELTEHFLQSGQAVLILVDPDPLDHDYLVIRGDRLTPNTRWWFKMIGTRERYVDTPTLEDLHHVLRVGIVGPESVMPPLTASLTDTFGERVCLQSFMAVKLEDHEDVHLLEAFAGGVNKWSGLTWLANEHGIDLSQVATIGDHVNDLAMIEAAGCGIAMGNAIDAVKAAAKRQTGTNDEAGVATAIERLLDGTW